MAHELYQALHALKVTYRSDLGRLPVKVADELLKVALHATLVDDSFGQFILPKQYPERYELRRALEGLTRVLTSRDP